MNNRLQKNLIISKHRNPDFIQSKSCLLVLSIDFDGCLFHGDYVKSTSQKRLIDTNQAFIQHVVDLINYNKFDEVVLMVGSNRQSKRVDGTDSKRGTESCFDALIKLCDEIKEKTRKPCRVDGFLLADIYGDRNSGESFEKALAARNGCKDKIYHHSDFVWDSYKYSILYSQMHKIASEHPDAKISYYFYDDRDEDILVCLNDFYKVNNVLRPHNIKDFRLFQYDGTKVREYASHEHFKGGPIDHFYRNNIKLMAVHCGYDPVSCTVPDDEGISGRLYGNNLKRFKNERKLKPLSICKELQFEINQVTTTHQNHGIYWESFLYELNRLHGEIEKDIKNQESQGLQQEKILRSHSVVIARDAVCMLRALQDEVMHLVYVNKERKQALLSYVDRYGDSQNTLKYSLKAIHNIFCRPSPSQQAAYRLSLMLEPLLNSKNVKLSSQEESCTKTKHISLTS